MAPPLFGSSKKKMAQMNNPRAPVHNVSWDRPEEQTTQSGTAKHDPKAGEALGWPLPNYGQKKLYGAEPTAQVQSDQSNRSSANSSSSTGSTGSTGNRRDPSKRMGGIYSYNASTDEHHRV